ncbi:MAG: hypothetical protein V4627_13610 [Pseudomonadota bacterium]
MNTYFVAAATTAFVVGLMHSVLGEILIFRRLRLRGFVPTNGGNVLNERHVRIIWATWHIVTVFGWCLGAVLLRLSLPAGPAGTVVFIEQAMVLAALAASALVFFGTRAKHPGWIGLLVMAVCAWLGGA